MRHSVVIQSESRTPDSRGGASKTWSTTATVFANIRPASAREGYQAGQLQGAVSHVVSARWITGIRPKMRILWGSRIFQITGVRNLDEESRIMQLDCVEELV